MLARVSAWSSGMRISSNWSPAIFIASQARSDHDE
jgi:hypothetical protein